LEGWDSEGNCESPGARQVHCERGFTASFQGFGELPIENRFYKLKGTKLGAIIVYKMTFVNALYQFIGRALTFSVNIDIILVGL
jgi:hypothetical protein